MKRYHVILSVTKDLGGGWNRRGDLQGRPGLRAKCISPLALRRRPVAARLASGDPEGRPYGIRVLAAKIEIVTERERSMTGLEGMSPVW